MPRIFLTNKYSHFFRLFFMVCVVHWRRVNKCSDVKTAPFSAWVSYIRLLNFIWKNWGVNRSAALDHNHVSGSINIAFTETTESAIWNNQVQRSVLHGSHVAWQEQFFFSLMQIIFIVSSMQHGCSAKLTSIQCKEKD